MKHAGSVHLSRSRKFQTRRAFHNLWCKLSKAMTQASRYMQLIGRDRYCEFRDLQHFVARVAFDVIVWASCTEAEGLFPSQST
jgi:hypothetical protein